MAVSQLDIKELHAVEGIRLSAVSAGIKVAGRLDLVLFELCDEAVTAGAYTQNAFCAAPVTICKQHTEECSPKYFLINTGNANAGTGMPGIQAAQACCESVASYAGLSQQQVLPFSTGVIGETLPIDKIIANIPKAFEGLNEHSWLACAQGIMTTDTQPKAFSTQIELEEGLVTITGMAKGAGMIKPNMATMLSYIFTDALIEQKNLKDLLTSALHKSFNRITVDGDTSTNDCAMLVATGKSKVSLNQLSELDLQKFEQALDLVFITLAKGLIKDAEGATKLVTVRVKEGLNPEECLQTAYIIAESPLVKTALFASDPNWGRILAAVGRAGILDLDISGIEIFLDDVCIVTNGAVSESYTEAQGSAVMNQDEIEITVKLGRGSACEVIWTSDLSHDYVRINAEYRT